MTLTLTPTAADRLQRFLATRRTADRQPGVRVSVEGGGCNGYKYSLAIAETPNPDDILYEQAELRLYIDGRSALLLEGTEIDYIEGLTQGGFKFNNPNAGSTCSCGHSFQPGQCPSMN
ncbi:MAG: iron-sulfur cluster assembly accessory protein [Spirulinaceae cyanobacterium RM2_2_10]|nr:iron-sulfur cluster assembly accessory protein [Spirulinaceae cyanobacterium SM2_1_0]NJO18815.1 iron-sulfur cluster assembly accessory protein [Spirulinaceae cyanobacterium RM2_2_10]